jgi:hypothetical protein
MSSFGTHAPQRYDSTFSPNFPDWSGLNRPREKVPGLDPGKEGGPIMDVPKVGEVLKYRKTGKIFKVRKITDEFVILHSRGGTSQILTGKNSLFSSFEKLAEMNGSASALEKFPGRNLR